MVRELYKLFFSDLLCEWLVLSALCFHHFLSIFLFTFFAIKVRPMNVCGIKHTFFAFNPVILVTISIYQSGLKWTATKESLLVIIWNVGSGWTLYRIQRVFRTWALHDFIWLTGMFFALYLLYPLQTAWKFGTVSGEAIML